MVVPYVYPTSIALTLDLLPNSFSPLSIVVYITTDLNTPSSLLILLRRRMAVEGDTEEITLERTPTWAVATVCFVLITTSVLIERALHLLAQVSNSQFNLNAYMNYYDFVVVQS